MVIFYSLDAEQTERLREKILKYRKGNIIDFGVNRDGDIGIYYTYVDSRHLVGGFVKNSEADTTFEVCDTEEKFLNKAGVIYKKKIG